MNLLGLIERNIAQRKLSSVLTTLSVALGVMLVAAILILRAELSSTYLRQGRGYQLVVGPPSTPLALVLNSVYHVDKSPGLLPFSVLESLETGEYRKLVKMAVPYSLGDSFRGYRVVATTSSVFHPIFPFPAAETTEDKFEAGRPFRFFGSHLRDVLRQVSTNAIKGTTTDHGHNHDPNEVWEAVVGHEVAKKIGIEIGDMIEPTHGVEGEDAHDHPHLWKVVGILKRSSSPIDRVVFINLDSFYRLSDHAGAVIPGTGEAALSSILLFPRGGYAKPRLIGLLNKRPELTMAEVSTEIRKLLAIVGNVDEILFLIAVLVVVIGVTNILVAIYNTMNERRRELAILRAIGARRREVFLSIVAEATALTFAGAVIGLVLAHVLVWALGDYVAEQSGLLPDPLRVLPEEFLLLALVTMVGALAGLIPAWKAYRTDVAKNLAPLS